MSCESNYCNSCCVQTAPAEVVLDPREALRQPSHATVAGILASYFRNLSFRELMAVPAGDVNWFVAEIRRENRFAATS